MGNFFDESVLVTTTGRERAVVCSYCDNAKFGTRRIKLNTSGAEFFGFAWANKESLALICKRVRRDPRVPRRVVQTTPAS